MSGLQFTVNEVQCQKLPKCCHCLFQSSAVFRIIASGRDMAFFRQVEDKRNEKPVTVVKSVLLFFGVSMC